MRGTPRVKIPRKPKKHGTAKRQLVTQQDYYEEATNVEEQAERWLLSDVKKALRFYLQAYHLYEAAAAQGMGEATEDCTYNVYYNETRLLLQVYSDYLGNEGYINVLRYLNLDDIPGLSAILLPLQEVVARLESVYEQYHNSMQDTWDLQSNLLTAYLMLLESAEICGLDGTGIVQLCDKFIPLAQDLISQQIDELESWRETSISQESESRRQETREFEEQSLTTESAVSSEGDYMSISDQVTVDTFTEVLVDCYKFVESTMEVIIESRVEASGAEEIALGVEQRRYLEEQIEKFYLEVDDVVATTSKNIPVELKDINTIKLEIAGLRVIADGNIELIKEYMDVQNVTGSDLRTKLMKIDLLDFTVACTPADNFQGLWELTTMLSKLLSSAEAELSKERTETLGAQVFDQERADRLSSVVFRLCSLYINSSDNELRRWVIKKNQNDYSPDAGADKVLNVLMRNSRTLLSNAMKIAEKPCGMQETIVDKLKRNYVYNQAKMRLSILNSDGMSEIPDSSNHFNDIMDLLRDHPYYSQLPVNTAVPC